MPKRYRQGHPLLHPPADSGRGNPNDAPTTCRRALAEWGRTRPACDTRASSTYLSVMTGHAADTTTLIATVERAAQGDELAFARLVATYQADLVRVAYVVTGDQALAEDAAEAAWWIAWRKLPSLREASSVRGWLVAVAANEARKLVGRRQRHAVAELRLDSPASTPDPGGDIDLVDLADALERLDPRDRAIIALRYVSDLESDEIGQMLHLSASGVRSRLARTLRRLRKDLDHV
jgi:RNA polymerase sigma-70 factor, ECF subfamily